MIRAGRLEVVGGEGSGPVMRVLGRGDALGELALLTSSPRSASARRGPRHRSGRNRPRRLRAVARGDARGLACSDADIGRTAPGVSGWPRSRGTGDDRPRPPRLHRPGQGYRGATLGRARPLGAVDLLDGTEVGPHPEGDLLASLRLCWTAPRPPMIRLSSWPAPRPGKRAGPTSPAAGRPNPRRRRRRRPTPWGSAQACPGGCDLVALNVAEGSGRLPDGRRRWIQSRRMLSAMKAPDADIERIARRLAGRSVGIVLSGAAPGRSLTLGCSRSSRHPDWKSTGSRGSAWGPSSAGCSQWE